MHMQSTKVHSSMQTVISALVVPCLHSKQEYEPPEDRLLLTRLFVFVISIIVICAVFQLRRVTCKPVYMVSDQVQYKAGCAATEDG